MQQEIAFEFAEQFIGFELDVLIDSETDEPGVFIGRTYADAPDIDASVIVVGEGIQPGDLIPVEITARDGYDLAGEAVVTEMA